MDEVKYLGLWTISFSTDLINYPTGMDLYPIEPLNGLVANMLPFFEHYYYFQHLGFNQYDLTGVCGSWFGRVLVGIVGVVWLVELYLKVLPSWHFCSHVGVGELNHLWWLPLGLGALVKARQTLDWGWFFVVSGCLIFAMISCFYLGFF